MTLLSMVMCQTNEFLGNFKNLKLPFTSTLSTFDIFASEDSIKLSEEYVQKYLLSKTDEYILRKSQQKLSSNNYYEYFSVGKYSISDYIIVLYYRNYVNLSNDIYTELVACVFDSKLNLLQTLSLSKYDTQLGIYSFCKINEKGEIEVEYFSRESVDSENLNIGKIKVCKYKVFGHSNVPYQDYEQN